MEFKLGDIINESYELYKNNALSQSREQSLKIISTKHTIDGDFIDIKYGTKNKEFKIIDRVAIHKSIYPDSKYLILGKFNDVKKWIISDIKKEINKLTYDIELIKEIKERK